MKIPFLFLSVCLINLNLLAQDAMPETSTHYESVPAYPETFTTGTALARMVDGLGFRYYWVTDGLREEDLLFRPSDEARSSLETLGHLHYMILFMENTVMGKVTTFPEPAVTMSYEEIRRTTLQRIQAISEQLSSMDNESIAKLEMKIKAGPDEMQVPFWHFLQGPIGDAYYHLGQVVSFRRSTGNPIDPNVQPFMGKRVSP